MAHQRWASPEMRSGDRNRREPVRPGRAAWSGPAAPSVTLDSLEADPESSERQACRAPAPSASELSLGDHRAGFPEPRMNRAPETGRTVPYNFAQAGAAVGKSKARILRAIRVTTRRNVML